MNIVSASDRIHGIPSDVAHTTSDRTFNDEQLLYFRSSIQFAFERVSKLFLSIDFVMNIKTYVNNYCIIKNSSILLCSKYSVLRTTQGLKVPYYVKENFHSEYQGSLRRLEISVEEEFVNNLRQACYREKNYSKYQKRVFFFFYYIHHR